jgi:hypothetical protein
MWLGRVFVFGLSLGVAMVSWGCSGGDDRDPAVAQCEDFASTWCSTATNCLVALGTVTEANRAGTFSACQDAAVASVPCEKAVDVGESYAQCVADVEHMDCTRWAVPVDQLSTVRVPETCQGAILISQ